MLIRDGRRRLGPIKDGWIPDNILAERRQAAQSRARACSCMPICVLRIAMLMSPWRVNYFASGIDAPFLSSSVICVCRPTAWKSATPSFVR